MSWNVFISRRIPEAGIEYLKNAGMKVDVYPHDQAIPRKDLLNRIHKYDALLAVLTEQVDQELLAAAKQLKIVANYAVGYNNIDVAACSQKGIAVSNTPGVLTEATADLTFALILGVAKRILEGDEMTRSGKFSGWGPLLLLGSDVSGKTLGVIGAGRIGSALIQRAAGFDMKIVYTDTRRKYDIEEKFGAKFMSLDELLEKSDFVTIHVPLNEETHHLIDEKRLRQMKKSAYLINTARGPIVDPDALYAALKTGQIASAALDVTDPEPIPANHKLLSLPNLIVAPHIASATVTSRTQMAMMAVQNLVAGVQGRELPFQVV